MTSVTRILPVGPLREACVASFDSAPHDPFWDLCANTTRGHDADFISICCDGGIINSAGNIWNGDAFDKGNSPLENWVCCRQAGRNPGGLLPLPADYTHCASGDPTPLASMAATDTDNAQNFAVTYISASAGTADWTTRSSPSCLWVNTNNVSGTTEVTLPAPIITTLPPESDDLLPTGYVPYTYSGTATMSSNATAMSNKETSGSASARPTPAPTNSATSQPGASSNAPAGNVGTKLDMSKWLPILSILLLFFGRWRDTLITS